jgi:hypothetical protein
MDTAPFRERAAEKPWIEQQKSHGWSTPTQKNRSELRALSTATQGLPTQQPRK